MQGRKPRRLWLALPIGSVVLLVLIPAGAFAWLEGLQGTMAVCGILFCLGVASCLAMRGVTWRELTAWQAAVICFASFVVVPVALYLQIRADAGRMIHRGLQELDDIRKRRGASADDLLGRAALAIGGKGIPSCGPAAKAAIRQSLAKADKLRVPAAITLMLLTDYDDLRADAARALERITGMPLGLGDRALLPRAEGDRVRSQLIPWLRANGIQDGMSEEEMDRMAADAARDIQRARVELEKSKGEADALGSRILALMMDEYNARPTREAKQQFLQEMVDSGARAVPMILDLLEFTSDNEARRAFVDVLQRITGLRLGMDDTRGLDAGRVKAVRLAVERWLRKEAMKSSRDGTW